MPSAAALARAARLRAAGCSWDSIADQLDKPAEALLKWPADARWPALLADAEKTVAVEAGAEAVLILRNLLRAEDEKVRRDAARLLLEARFRLAAPPAPPDPLPAPRSADARRLVAFLEDHTDDELARLAATVYTASTPPPPVGELQRHHDGAD